MPTLPEVQQSVPNRVSNHIDPELVNLFIEGRVTVFVGSGVSAAALPTWSGLMDSFRRPLGKLPEGSTFPEIAQFYEDKLGRNRTIQTLVDALRVRPTCEALGVHRALFELPVRHVFTTNFDRLLEDAVQEKGQDCTRIVLDDQVSQFRFEDSASIHIVKVHGDLEIRSSITLTSNDYEGFFRKRSAMRRLTEFVLQTRYVLFLGYSFRDPDIQTMWSQVVAEAGDLAIRSYIVLFDPSDVIALHLKLKKLNVIALDRGTLDRSQILTEWLTDLATEINAVKAKTSAPTSNLPPLTYLKFIARSELQRQLENCLHGQNAITSVQGPMGNGKSSLTNKFARGYAASRSQFRFDHIIWVVPGSLKAPSECLDAVLNDIARALDFQLLAQLPATQYVKKGNEVRSLLREKAVLLIIDDYQRGKSTLFDDWLLGLSKAGLDRTRVFLLRHTTEALPFPANTVFVNGLGVKEALELVREQARALEIERALQYESENTLIEFVKQVRGNPKVIEQAIGLVAQTGKKLGELLTSLYTHTTDEINEMLGILCAGSWSELSQSARWVLTASSVFPALSPMRHEALQEVAGINNSVDFENAVRELLDFRLLVADIVERRYSLHPTTRTFACERMHEEVGLEHACRSRLAKATVEYLNEAIVRPLPEPRYWNALVSEKMDAIDSEWPGIKETINWILLHDPPMIVDVTMLLIHYLDSRFLNQERLEYVNKAIEVCARSHREEELALLHLDALAWTYIEEGDLERAEDEIRQGMESIAKMPTNSTKELQALAYAWQARIKAERTDLPGSNEADAAPIQLFAQAEELISKAIATEPTGPWILARIHMASGDINFKQKKYAAALAVYEQAIQEEEAYGGEARQYQLAPRVGLANLGLYSEAKISGGTQAEVHLEEARKRFQELAAQKSILIGTLYGEYGLALVDAMVNDVSKARQRIVEIRKNLERQTSPSVLKKLIDNLSRDLQSLQVESDPT